MGKVEKLKKSFKAAEKFDGKGVDFKCKLIGFVNVPSPRGDDICQEAISKLKHMAVKANKEKKEHKQKITVNITIKGIRLIDEQTERIEHAHPINRISYISHDSEDKRTFGYIVGTKEGYMLFAIRTMKEAEHITNALKELFEVVYQRHQAKKAAETREELGNEDDDKPENGETEVAEESKEEQTENTSPLVDWEQLNEQIETMQNDGLTQNDPTDFFADFDTPSSQTQKGFNDPFTDVFSSNTTTQQPSDDFNPFGISQASEKQNKNDFFTPQNGDSNTSESTNTPDFFAPDKASSTITNGVTAEEPLLINDPFAELKKNIDEMHKQNQAGFQSGGFIPPTNQSGGFIPPTNQAVNNPFANPQPMFTPNRFQAPAQPMGLGFNVPPPLPARNQVQRPPMQPPQNVAVTNPFQQPIQTSTLADEPDNGWTVNKRPSPMPRPVPKPSQPVADPFAFLNDQTGPKPLGANNPQPMSVNAMATTNVNSTMSPSATNELLDFLG